MNRLLLCMPLLLAALSSQAGAECRYTELAALGISVDERISDTPYLDAQINGKSVHMLIDTGAFKTVLTRAELDRQQVTLTRISEIMSGIGGRAPMFSARPKEVVIGPTRLHQTSFPVVEGFDFPGYGGIIGADYLLQADLEIALADKQLKFFRGAGCDDKSLAYWDAKALDVPLETLSRDGRAIVPVTINGSKLMALIDTGATISLVDQHTAERLGFDPASAGTRKGNKLQGLNGKTRQSWITTFDSFAIGEEQISHPRITVMESVDGDLNARDHQVILGRDFLLAHHVLLSTGQRRFYYSYLGGPVFAASHGTEQP
ncbi:MULTISPECIES: retroviral-like aspartic protease family protein [unclassified Duganella]|uniref:retroviral-like aspartic protease family protein n=1 Tax=unclassified Duganella TaxID=2636909 RepID=UPI000E34C265|nr:MULTISPECIES: retroviral-like aspartic protease family protein [unclassified Duganella]RFP13777.1 hypothetical protein D0T23_15365 [Duganella sp. BJB475]RFP36485.1 hypothetical protein D0T21_08720 [Duganella sp. BJB476]